MKLKSLTSIKTDDFIFCLYCMAYMALTVLPMIKYSVSYVIAGSFCLIPVALSFLKFPERRLGIFIIAVSGVVCGLFSWLLSNAELKEIANTTINYLRFFMPCLLLAVISKMSGKVRWVVWLFATLLLLFVAWKTLSAIDSNETVARILAAGYSDDKLDKYRMDNVGGFGFCYAAGFTFPLWISVVADNKRWVKVFAVLLAIATFYFVLKAQYMILLILCVFAVLLAIMSHPGNALRKLFGLMLVLAVLISMPFILKALMRFDLGSQVSKKIGNIASFLDGSTAIQSVSSRIGKYTAAFNEFIRSPVWGTVSSQQAGICHSTWLRLGCTTGFFGIFSYIAVLTVSYQVVSGVFNKYRLIKAPFIITFITLIVLAFVNPVDYSYEISFVIFFFVPLTMLLFGKKKEGKENAELGA